MAKYGTTKYGTFLYGEDGAAADGDADFEEPDVGTSRFGERTQEG